MHPGEYLEGRLAGRVDVAEDRRDEVRALVQDAAQVGRILVRQRGGDGLLAVHALGAEDQQSQGPAGQRVPFPPVWLLALQPQQQLLEQGPVMVGEEVEGEPALAVVHGEEGVDVLAQPKERIDEGLRRLRGEHVRHGGGLVGQGQRGNDVHGLLPPHARVQQQLAQAVPAVLRQHMVHEPAALVADAQACPPRARTVHEELEQRDGAVHRHGAGNGLLVTFIGGGQDGT
mmetsp:Transcript_81367/g.218793  ORF Transcript_81367/g.218793 Transcript_81367/m.218793 type:complete len:230 (+) Transcript_81367:1132-1821(+)